MSSSSDSKNGRRRNLPREVRRDQLIRATMRSIARNGLSGTTMAQVTQEAGLSQGIVNLHFESKDKLLLETLRHVTDEYNRGHDAILGGDDYPNLAAKLEALLEYDFNRKVTEKNKLAVWFAFWGEAKSRPTYQRICNHRDALAEGAIADLFQAVIDEGAYTNVNPQLLATGYTAMIDGLWLDLLVVPRNMTLKKARLVARQYLYSAFPNHVSPSAE